eukprot:tig00021433_g21267.t1
MAAAVHAAIRAAGGREQRGQVADAGNRGLAAFKSGDLLAAIEHFSAALALDPNSKIALFNRAVVYEKLGRYCDAYSDLSGWVNDSRAAPELILAGRVCAGLGDNDQAIKYYQKVLDADPTNKAAIRGQGRARDALVTQRARPSLRPSVGGNENDPSEFGEPSAKTAPRTSMSRIPFSPLGNLQSQADPAHKRKPLAAQLSTPSPTGIAAHEKKKAAAARAAVSPQPLKLSVLERDEDGAPGPSRAAAAPMRSLEAVEEEPPLATQAGQASAAPAAAKPRKRQRAAAGMEMLASPQRPAERRRIVAADSGAFEPATEDRDAEERLGTQAAPASVALVLRAAQQQQPRRGPQGSLTAGVDAAMAFIVTMKAAADNRISDRNCWQLQLTEHVEALARGRVDRRRLEEAQVTPLAVTAADGSVTVDFAVAGVVVDACARIYSVRVDVFHSWILRTQSGLTQLVAAAEGQAQPRQSQALDGPGASAGNAAERRRARQAERAFLVEEGEEEKIGMEGAERAAAVPDPLFSVAAAKFDEGGAKGMLLCSLGVRSDGQLCLDSAEAPHVAAGPAGPAPALDLVPLRVLLPAGALGWGLWPATPGELFEAAGLEALREEEPWDGRFDPATDDDDEEEPAPRPPVELAPRSPSLPPGAGLGEGAGGGPAGGEAFFDPEGEPLDDFGAGPLPDFDAPPPPEADADADGPGGAGSDDEAGARGPGPAAVEALPLELRRTFRQHNPFWKFPLAAHTGETPAKERPKRARRGALRVDFAGEGPAPALLALAARQPRRPAPSAPPRPAPPPTHPTRHSRRAGPSSSHATVLRKKRQAYSAGSLGATFLRGERGAELVGENQYEVEAILASRERKGRVEYLLKWFNYPLHESQWVPEERLECAELVAAFEEGRRAHPGEAGAGEGEEGPGGGAEDGEDGDGGLGFGPDFGDLGGFGKGPAEGAGADEGLVLVAAPRRAERVRVAYARLPLVIDVRRLKTSMWSIVDQELQGEEGCSFQGTVRRLAGELREDAAQGRLAPGVLFACLLHLANERGLRLRASPALDELYIAPEP